MDDAGARARRRQQVNAANQRHRQKRRDELRGIRSEISSKQRELSDLLVANVRLKARERVLVRALESAHVRMSGLSVGEGGGGAEAAAAAAAVAAAAPAGAGGGGGSSATGAGEGLNSGDAGARLRDTGPEAKPVVRPSQEQPPGARPQQPHAQPQPQPPRAGAERAPAPLPEQPQQLPRAPATQDGPHQAPALESELSQLWEEWVGEARQLGAAPPCRPCGAAAGQPLRVEEAPVGAAAATARQQQQLQQQRQQQQQQQQQQQLEPDQPHHYQQQQQQQRELELGWAVAAPSGDEVLEAVLRRCREIGSGAAAGLPADVLAPFSRRFHEFVEATRAAAASGAPADAARARRLFVTLHGYTRVVLAVNPLVGAQLRSINLDTLRREAPPAGYWARVLRRAGLIGALGRFPAPALAELRERLRLHRASMDKLRREQKALAAEMAVLAEELRLDVGELQLSAACPDALSARHARYQSLLRSLELSQRSESSLASLLMWGVYKLEPLELAAAIHAEAWPWWIDGWGALEVVAEHLDRGEGASGGGDDGDG